MCIYAFRGQRRKESKCLLFRNPEVGKLPEPLKCSDIQERLEHKVQHTPSYRRKAIKSEYVWICVFIYSSSFTALDML